MDHQSKEKIIYRIVTGEQRVTTLNRGSFIIKNPSPQVRLEAIEIYEDSLQKNRFNDCWLSPKECINVLVANDVCEKEIEGNLIFLEEEIDNTKVSLYKSMYKPDLRESNKKRLVQLKAAYQKSFNNRHSLDHITMAGYAEMVKRQYIMFHTLYYENGEKVWQKEEDISVNLIEMLLYRMVQQAIGPDEIREISRTEPWRSYWSIKKNEVFDKAAFDLTEEQRSLILYSRMYDSAYEHPECPSDEALKDNDMFDGWMISEQRARDKDKMTQQLDKNMHKGKSEAGEVFIPAKTKEDRDRINQMNDTRGDIVRKQRLATVKKLKVAKDTNFLDVKADLNQQSNQQFMQTVKGK